MRATATSPAASGADARPLWPLVRAGGSPPRARLCRLRPADQAGQSLTELVLFLPILILGVLGAVSLGLALRAHTQLTQTTQQAAQFLFEHPTTSDCASSFTALTYHTCAETIVTKYLQAHGFADCASPTCTVTVSFGVTKSGVLEDTITVSYPYKLLTPLPKQLNSGALHGSSLTLSVTETTLAALPVIKDNSCASSGSLVCAYYPCTASVQTCPNSASALTNVAFKEYNNLGVFQTSSTSSSITQGGSPGQPTYSLSACTSTSTCRIDIVQYDGLTTSVTYP